MMSKIQFAFVVLVALVAVVYGGGDGFVPAPPLPEPKPVDPIMPIDPVPPKPVDPVIPAIPIMPVDPVLPVPFPTSGEPIRSELPPGVIFPISAVAPSIESLPAPVELPSIPSMPVVVPVSLPAPIKSLPAPVIPSIQPLPLPSIATEPPRTGTGPSFNDVASMNGSPPDCVYPWLDPLRLFNPTNQNGDCKLGCKAPKWKKQWKVGAFLFFGGRDVCCCV